MNRLVTEAEGRCAPEVWMPAALWSHGRELSNAIALVLGDGGTNPADENAAGPFMSAIRREWARRIDDGAQLPRLPQLGAFIKPHGQLILRIPA
jgi:hypothetical protein